MNSFYSFTLHVVMTGVKCHNTDKDELTLQVISELRDLYSALRRWVLFNEPPCNKSSKTHVCLFTITFFCINKPQSSFTALARHLLWLLFLLVILYFKVHTNWRPHRFTSNPLSLPPCAAHPLRCILHLWVFWIYPAHMLSPSRPPPPAQLWNTSTSHLSQVGLQRVQ